MNLLDDIHKGLLFPGEVAMVTGKYDYYHYTCDGQDDQGWGCGYRTLQTISSWIRYQMMSRAMADVPVPSIGDIQSALVAMEDKPSRFIGSRDWIGSFEVALCLDYFYDVPGKIVHISSGDKLRDHLQEIVNHFRTVGAALMMGGDTDNSSKGILGVCLEPANLLVLDPHFHGIATNINTLQEQGWVKWRPLDSFKEDSFYNICFPQFHCS